jgi:hypothetical protein
MLNYYSFVFVLNSEGFGADGGFEEKNLLLKNTLKPLLLHDFFVW